MVKGFLLAAALLLIAAAPAATMLVDYGDSYDFKAATSEYLPHCAGAMLALSHGKDVAALPPDWSASKRNRAIELCSMFLFGGMFRDRIVEAEIGKGAKPALPI